MEKYWTILEDKTKEELEFEVDKNLPPLDQIEQLKLYFQNTNYPMPHGLISIERLNIEKSALRKLEKDNLIRIWDDFHITLL